MSGVLRLGNTGAGTGRSTLIAAASNDQTFTLPEAGGTLLTSNYSVPGGTITFDGSTINITNGDLNVDSGTLFVDEANNRVGIGTTTPSAKLHVEGDILLANGSDLYFATSSNPAPRISNSEQQNSLSLFTNATESVRITDTGRVGIGTGDPQQLLHLRSAQPFMAITSDTDDNEIGILYRTTTGLNYGKVTFNFNSNVLLFRASSDGAGEDMQLSAGGELYLTHGNDCRLRLNTNGTGGNDANWIRGDGDNVKINCTAGTGQVIFEQGGNSTLVIDGDSRVLIGTSSSRAVLSTGSPGLVQIEVQGGSAWPLTLMANRDDQFGPILGMCKSRGTTAGSQTAIQSGDACGQIFFGGTDGIGEVGAGYLRSLSVAAPVTGVGVPADLVFATGNESGTVTERLRLESEGRFTQSGGVDANGGGANFSYSTYYRMNGRRSIPPNATVAIVISGLQNGYLTIKGGGYSSAGQSQFACMYQAGGFMTATNTYQVETLQEWTRGATITMAQNASNITITIVNGSSTYTLTSNWVFETSSSLLTVTS